MGDAVVEAVGEAYGEWSCCCQNKANQQVPFEQNGHTADESPGHRANEYNCRPVTEEPEAEKHCAPGKSDVGNAGQVSFPCLLARDQKNDQRGEEYPQERVVYPVRAEGEQRGRFCGVDLAGYNPGDDPE